MSETLTPTPPEELRAQGHTLPDYSKESFVGLPEDARSATSSGVWVIEGAAPPDTPVGTVQDGKVVVDSPDGKKFASKIPDDTSMRAAEKGTLSDGRLDVGGLTAPKTYTMPGKGRERQKNPNQVRLDQGDGQGFNDDWLTTAAWQPWFTEIEQPKVNTNVFPVRKDSDRSFEFRIPESTPYAIGVRGEEAERRFQYRMAELQHEQRVREFVGRRVQQGKGYMARMTDEELEEHGGEELRPTTREQLKMARELEELRFERQQEVAVIAKLSKINDAEISSGHGALTRPTPTLAPDGTVIRTNMTRSEQKGYEFNEKRLAQAHDRIHEYDHEFHEIVSAPLEEANRIIDERAQELRGIPPQEQEGVVHAMGNYLIARMGLIGDRVLLEGTSLNLATKAVAEQFRLNQLEKQRKEAKNTDPNDTE